MINTLKDCGKLEEREREGGQMGREKDGGSDGGRAE
jgi:hypothetical protein